MEITNKQIALSIEQMKTLESLGLDTNDASLIWFDETTYDGKHFLEIRENADIDSINFICNAYTFQDLFNHMPSSVEVKDVYGKAHLAYPRFWGNGFNQMALLMNNDVSSVIFSTSDSNPLQASYEMLKYLLENKNKNGN